MLVTSALYYLYCGCIDQVKQSWLTTVFTTLLSTVEAFSLLLRIRPQLILCNGPGKYSSHSAYMILSLFPLSSLSTKIQCTVCAICFILYLS